jgi:probable selenate reductase FAD-binding subunit
MAQKYSIRDYFQPETLQKASELLTLYPEEARLLAGGTDLLNRLPQKSGKGIKIVSLKKVAGLRGIRQDGAGNVSIGAMTTHAEVAGSPIILQDFPALAKASSLVGSPSIRNLGTIGGNIVNASPSADTAPPLLVYEATAVVWSPQGEKQVPVEEFFTGPSSTVLRRGEILKGFVLKKAENLKARYEKLGTRKAQEIATVNLCVSVNAEATSNLSEIRIALGAVAPTPFRARKTEAHLRVDEITGDLITAAGQLAMSEASPISDLRASSDYRREMIAVLVQKLLTSLMGEIGVSRK